MNNILLILSTLLTLAGCSILGGPPYLIERTTLADVEARHGPAPMRWQTDGATTLIYPSGPNGSYTLKFEFLTDSRLKTVRQVLTEEDFAQVQPGMSMDEVQRLIGPPYAPWTVYFSARDELVWEWRYCDTWGELARFNVLFDGTSKRVRSRLSLTEKQHFGGRSRPCSGLYLPVQGPTQSSPATLPSGNSSSVNPK